MKRPALIWFTFFLFLALGLSAMAWMTRTVMRLDQAQARATATAQLEENIRLALWRMDYTLAPVLSQEIARPYFEYSPVFPAERAYTRMYTELKSGDVLVPSPLLKSSSPYILLHFQIQPDGKVTSPQVPVGNVRKIAESRYTTAADIQQAETRLAEVSKLVESPALLASLPEPREMENWNNNKIRVTSNGSISNGIQATNGRDNRESNNVPQQAATNRENFNVYANSSPSTSFEQQALIQQKRGQQEYAVRQQTQVETNDFLLGANSGNYVAPGVSFAIMTPFWAGDTLLLARRVSINGQTYVQGCLLDWPAIRKSLLDSAADLLPQADLVPVRADTPDTEPRRLASIPARLVLSAGANPDSSLTVPLSSFIASPTGVTLVIAWLGVILASAAVAILLRGVIALSQRRAGFVSAVTHELRTPLTTLRMYTEMLADGMVVDPEKQASYHKTLRAEANRLGHLVDNVLLYSRLERSNRDTKVESAPLASLLDRLTRRLADRASQAGMNLNVIVADDAQDLQIKANLLSVEQILFNLVDNACKYASAAADRNIELRVNRNRNQIEIHLSDQGPGLDAVSRSRLFEPFSKSVHEAANSAPGLGLGLALSHRLAKNMSANLRHVPAPKGATFILTLPQA